MFAAHDRREPARRLRVLHVLLSLEPGGLENGVVNVVNGLDPARFESEVVCLKHAGEFARRIADPSVRVHEMDWRGGNDLRLPLKLARLFRARRADIVHTRNAEPFFHGFVGAKLARVPALVHSEHGRTFDDRAVRFVVQRWMTRFTDAVFAVSTQLKTDLVRHVGLPEARVEVLYNGVDLGRFGVDDGAVVEAGSAVGTDVHARAAWHAELGLPPGAFVIGSVGRLVAVKNYGLLLRACARAGLAARRVHVVLVGEGPERAALEAQAQGLGIAAHVHLVGHRNDVQRLLPAFDLFVLPSLSEGMSNTLLEALAAGVPAVASDVGGNREIVRDGIEGRLFPSEDEGALADALSRLVDDAALRRTLGEAARQRARSSFDLRAMVGRYEELYERVAARRNA
ncbi:MAG TPA: glycosyltransferase [Burkholderiaceae bacterium]|nr:glycosyltransferase [Burkholderiaceae bacterium]